MNLLRNTLTAALLLSASLLNAQPLKVPAGSPLQSWKQNFGLGEISVEYSRPLARNRVIYGELVPFDKIWRTGANQATKITFTEDVSIESKPLKAGTYAMYTIPGKTGWDIIFYKDLTMGGNLSKFNPADEILRVTVKPEALTRAVQSFTINLDQVDAADALLLLTWEKTLVPVKIHSDVDNRIMKDIEKVMAVEDSRPYFQAANYYYEHDRDLKQALMWSDKAIAQNKAFFTVHLKAKIQMKMKDYKGAIATAEESLRLAQEAKNEDYVRLNEKLIAEAKKAG